MPKFDPPKFKPGDPWKAEHAQAIVDELKALGGFRGSGSVQVRRGARGVQISLSPEAQFYIGKTTTAITARSATVPGVGTVEVYWDDGTGTLIDAGFSIDVKHFSSTAILTGKYCSIGKDPFGTWWVKSVEC